MKIFSLLILSLQVCSFSLFADEAGARKLIDEYEQEVSDWTAKVNAADGLEARRELWQVAPQADQFGEKLLRQLDGSWNQSWFLKYAPKLLLLAPGYSVTPVHKTTNKTPLSVVRDSAERFHFESPLMGQLCLALAIDKGPATRKFLERVEVEHPSGEVQGQAAMALALLSRELGDGGQVAQFRAQRLKWVRKAIIEAADVEVGATTVGQIANDFLFSTMNLEKGREAPEILGLNGEQLAMRLTDNRGKPMVIVFWHSRMEAAEETMTFMRKLEERLAPRGLVVLGVANEEPLALRQMVKDGDVTWKNWLDGDGKVAKLYQVNKYPACWVLDEKGVVQLRGVPGPFAEITAEALVKELEKKN